MRLVDLTLPLYDGMPVYDGDPPVRVTKVCTREKDGWEVRELRMSTHSGTHVDAPVHMHEGGRNLDEVPLTQFCGPAVVVRIAAASFPQNKGLLFYEAVPADCVPRIVAANALFVGGPLEEEAERLLLSRGIITYTELVNVEELIGESFTFYGLPLRIRGGDGSPVRAVAVIDDK
ncbi:hypothetical protein, unknown function [Leishmania braziliensis MHOM/BR/75/M2904]|uniref:Cyclase n=2 Tax=Leishmania braziliensis species complex TaxID=37617 RepID=A4HJU5_LEIBR|nr:hypothetical protein, unknown function [Leishmania braziliensis MHOM/BR/75/M2904]AKK31275.1 hypothetical protein [Leishmania braziliensis]AKK31276.1 hypothetical protein [Leishmania braziliensis complex EV-2015]KAI5688043.1 putative cyclase [Leishmania braziliensis]CAJ2478127.1 unnamed protein product [Leishmania braziliensis]CAJ2478610.1 unnamed protein product [Leishmania braziliensis]